MWWRNLQLLFGFSLFLLVGGLVPSHAQALSLEQTLYRSALEALRQQRSGEAYALLARLGNFPRWSQTLPQQAVTGPRHVAAPARYRHEDR